MITRDDRDILRKALSSGPKTTREFQAFSWGRGAWGKLKEFMEAGYTERVGSPKPPFRDMDGISWRLTSDGVARLQQPEAVASTERFLRFDAWCDCERSCNSATRALEAGVSVYECYAVGAHWYPIESRAISKNELTLSWAPWFLVSGDVQPGAGSDGEPLLKNVTPVRGLQWEVAQKRFAAVAIGLFKNKNHPGHGATAGCRCT
jgi:hypothetical protein